MKCRIIAIYLFISVNLAISTPALGMGRGINDLVEPLPAPRLMYPILDTLNLTGKDNVEFKWISGNVTSVEGYEFKLYRGYDMIESNLIYKARMSQNEDSVEISSGKFEINQVYTWAVRQIALGGQKSDKSFSSFKVTKQ